MSMHTFTNSERKSATCPQRWLLRYGLRLRPHYRARPLVLGSLWHELMSCWWQAMKEDPNAAADKCKVLLIRLVEEEKGNVGGFNPHGASGVTEAEVMEIGRLLWRMLCGYHRRYSKDHDLTVVHDEIVLSHRTIGKRGGPGHSMVTGRIDKIAVDWAGEYWLVEHKTSSTKLEEWRNRNGYDPQAPTYAWLARKTLGISVVGVCYDLAKSAAEPLPDMFKVVGKGDRLSKRLPANTTHRAFKRALEHHGFTEHDEAWYQEKLTELEDQEDPFFRRELVRFASGEVDRVGRELHAIAQQLRGYQRTVDSEVEYLCDSAPHSDFSDLDWQQQVVKIIEEVGDSFPRNSQCCYSYNRPCSYMDLCKHRNDLALHGLHQIGGKHSELDEPPDEGQ